jgi:hypothetical protein
MIRHRRPTAGGNRNYPSRDGTCGLTRHGTPRIAAFRAFFHCLKNGVMETAQTGIMGIVYMAGIAVFRHRKASWLMMARL